MMKKIMLALTVVLTSMIFLGSDTFAQQGLQETIRSYMESFKTSRPASNAGKEEVAQSQTEWQTVICPKDGREFQIEVDANNIEDMRGLKEVVCPYDGTTFFPRVETLRRARKDQPEYITVRSPFVGREFKTKIDFDALLNGEPLIDPYTGKEFYFTTVKKSDADMRTTETGWQVVQGADGGRFRVKLSQEQPQEKVFSPYDGTEIKTDARTHQSLSVSEEPSIIEKMFSKGMPLTISKSIKQFGYDIFSEAAYYTQTEKSSGASGTLSRYYSKNLDRNVLSSMARDSSLKEEMGNLFEGELYSPLISIPVGPDYVLGPYDTIIINIWGNLQQSFPVTVDAEGKVILPKAGPLYVWGMKFSDAEKAIIAKLLENYANIQVGISMGRLHSMRVFVLGEVRFPGAHILSAQSSVFHALYAAGGPTKLGTLRKIKLIRSDKSEELIDLYRILIDGDKSQDYPLAANDTIVVPPIGPVVGVAGNVKRPAIYELASTAPLNKLLDISGGVNSVGYLQRIQVERVKDHQRKEIMDLEFKSPADLEKTSTGIHIQDGDLVLIFPVTQIRRNFVTISGNVQRPGDYELKGGMTAKDLIEKADGLQPGSFLERGEISRFKDDRTREVVSFNLGNCLRGDENANPLLKEWDVLTVYSKSDVTQAAFIEIEGAVEDPGMYELMENMRISDLIFRAGGLKPTASLENAELFRVVLGEQPKVLKINLQEALNNREKDLLLQKQDQLFIREDAKWNKRKLVTLSGEVRYPGVYAAEDGERLSSIIKRAGGFTVSAYSEGAVFTRESLKTAQQKALRHFIESEQRALLQEQASLSTGFSESQKEARMREIEFRDRQLKSLETIESLGRMVVRLAFDKFEESEYDIPVEDGDTLHIPATPSSVLVIGNVYNPTAVTYKKEKSVNYYLAMAGGVTKNADKKAIYVIGANGEAKAQFVSAREVKRGDTIVVPEGFIYKTPSGILLKDSVSTISQIATVGLLAASVAK